MKTANPELNKRMRKASSMIAAGTRRNNSTLLNEGRRMSAVAHIENQILLGSPYLQDEDVQALAELLVKLEIPTTPAVLLQVAPAPSIPDEYEDEESDPDL